MIPALVKVEEVNRMTRRTSVDDSLESLHKTLRLQSSESQVHPSDQIPVVLVRTSQVPPLSRKPVGGRVARSRKTPEDGSSGAKAKKDLARADELLDIATALGAETLPIEERLEHARHALKRGELGKARYAIQKSTSRLRDAILSEYELQFTEHIRRLDRTDRVGGNTRPARDALRASKVNMDDGNLKEAVSHLFRSDKLNKEAQTEVVLRVLYDSKNSFMIANKAGLDITPAVTLVNESRAKLREGEIEDAIALARKAADSVNSVLGTHGKARSMLLTCSRAVAAVEGIGGEVEAAQKKLDDIRGDFKCGKYESCISSSRALITEMKYSAHERAASFVGLAERASALAKDAGIRTPDSDDYIAMARDALSKDEFAKCIEYSNLSMLRSNTMLAAELEGKVRRVDRFAKDISGEMSSLSEVEKAIGSSRERNLEAVRRYAQMTEDIIGQAYNSATSYTRVTQDIVKQACQNLLESDPVPGVSQDGNCSIEGEGSGGSHAARSIEYEDQRLRIVDLYLSGKISNSELDRLLTMIDSGQSRNSLI